MSSSSSPKEEEPPTTIVLDTGSDTTKVGFAGLEEPKAVFPTVVGYQAGQNDGRYGRSVGDMKPKAYVGDSAYNQCGVLKLRYPMEGGIVTDWNAMESVWHHSLFNKLHIDPTEYRMLMTEKTVNQNSQKIMAEMMFETFNVPGLLISLQSVLALYANGRSTGVVLDSGNDTSTVTPIYEGKVVQRSMKHLDFGGKHVSQYLLKLLSIRGYSFAPTQEERIIKEMKEKLCQVSSVQTWWKKEDINQVDYKLPDGSMVKVFGEKFAAAELLFHPHIFEDIGNSESPGMHTAIHGSIIRCFPDPHPRHFILNIVLAGGNTMFQGLQERLMKEVTELLPQHMPTAKVIAEPERKYSAWIGGSIYGSLSSFDDELITSDEYQEFGAEVFHRKCAEMCTHDTQE